MRKEDLWEIYDRWDGRTPKPDDRVHFHTLEDALDQVEEFAEVLESDVPITLDENRTYRFFGNGKVILRWKG